jgi:DNA (cytosine-5)-methyltransferase 1
MKLSYPSLPEHLKHHKNADTPKFKDRFCVHGLNEMPHTIVAHISKDGHYNIHPIQNRSITVREAARIQSFPDNYRFEGPRTAQFLQVGNAVPPLFSYAISSALRDILALHEVEENG